jgi:hypothetical protein
VDGAANGKAEGVATDAAEGKAGRGVAEGEAGHNGRRGRGRLAVEGGYGGGARWRTAVVVEGDTKTSERRRESASA